MKKFYKNILSKDLASKIYHEFMPVVIKDNTGKYLEKFTIATDYKTIGVTNFSSTLLEINHIDKIITNDFGNNYKFTHSYLRVYPDDSVLHPHVDRPGLDLTLTVNIHSTENSRWPIYFSNMPLDMLELTEEHTTGNANCYKLFEKHMSDAESYITEIGDGVCCTRDIPHWRKRFYVKEIGDHFVQVFYHWQLI